MKSKFFYLILLGLALILVELLGRSVPRLNLALSPLIVTTTVSRVIDGDTIEVNLNGKLEKVRLIGIDSPEIVDPRKPIQCFAKEASDKAKSLLTNQIIRLESDVSQGERDKYGRLLRYVFLNDNNFNKLMISEGFAHEYTYNIPYKYQKEFKNAESQARENKKGLWSDNSKCYN